MCLESKSWVYGLRRDQPNGLRAKPRTPPNRGPDLTPRLWPATPFRCHFDRVGVGCHATSRAGWACERPLPGHFSGPIRLRQGDPKPTPWHPAPGEAPNVTMPHRPVYDETERERASPAHCPVTMCQGQSDMIAPGAARRQPAESDSVPSRSCRERSFQLSRSHARQSVGTCSVTCSSPRSGERGYSRLRLYPGVSQKERGIRGDQSGSSCEAELRG